MTHIDRLLDRGNSLLLFPEGTRNRSGAVGRLRFGAAKIASQHGALIVPIYIEGTRAALPPGRRWLRRRHRGLDPRRHLVTITIGQGEPAMIRRVASTPSTPGMIRSIRIRSGRSARAFSTASAPFFASQAT